MLLISTLVKGGILLAVDAVELAVLLDDNLAILDELHSLCAGIEDSVDVCCHCVCTKRYLYLVACGVDTVTIDRDSRKLVPKNLTI